MMNNSNNYREHQQTAASKTRAKQQSVDVIELSD
jgi:hypothetical protein